MNFSARLRLTCGSLALLGGLLSAPSSCLGQDSKATKPAAAAPTGSKATRIDDEVRAVTDKLVKAINESKADAVAELFLADGELIDEKGTIYQGRAEITALIKAYGERFPGAQANVTVDSVRSVGDLVMVDGTRVVSVQDGKSFSVVRFSSIWKRADKDLKIASLRDFEEAVPVSPHEALESLQWLIGDWVNEGAGTRVEIAYRWSEDGNFIVGELNINAEGKVAGKSSQRIGWDAQLGKVRSWTFDSDGGFGESVWSASEAGWLMQSTAVTPTGERGSAMVRIEPLASGGYKVRGTHRVIGDVAEPDFEFVVAKKPPKPLAAELKK